MRLKEDARWWKVSCIRTIEERLYVYVSGRGTVSNWRTSLWKFTAASWTICVLGRSSAASLNCSKYREDLRTTATVTGLLLMWKEMKRSLFDVCCYLLQATFLDMGRVMNNDSSPVLLVHKERGR